MTSFEFGFLRLKVGGFRDLVYRIPCWKFWVFVAVLLVCFISGIMSVGGLKGIILWVGVYGITGLII